MATALQSLQNSRYTDISDEPVDRLLSPIRGYEDKPLLPLNETIQPVSGSFNDVQDYTYVALHNCQKPADGLTQQESASIHLYTMQFHGGPSLYLSLNQSLRAENRDELIPWFSFLKLFLTALHTLPSQNEKVWRGIKNVDLRSKYKKGIKFAWWGVSSCTTDIEILQSNHFLGKHGLRTLFSIDCINGKSISNHSYFKNKEKEIILLPGSYFEVIGQLDSGSDLHIIQLKEIPPPITFIKPPFFKPPNITSSSSTVHQSNPLSPPSSNQIKQDTPSNIIAKEIPFTSNTTWKQLATTIAGGNGDGQQLNQLSRPCSIAMDDDQTLMIADQGNNRIVEWPFNVTKGRIVAGGQGQGDQTNQLWGPTEVIVDQENHSLIIADSNNRRVLQWPRQKSTKHGEILFSDIDCWGLTMDQKGSLYVSDWKKNEVKRWKRGETEGTIVAGGNGQGDRSRQLHCPTYLFVDADESLYVSDQNNHRVMKWRKDAKKGIVVAGGNGKGQSLRELCHPARVLVDPFGQIYVADYCNHRVMRWCEGAKEGTIVVGGNGHGQQANQLNCPVSLSFDRQGNLYVVDFVNHRIQKFVVE